MPDNQITINFSIVDTTVSDPNTGMVSVTYVLSEVTTALSETYNEYMPGTSLNIGILHSMTPEEKTQKMESNFLVLISATMQKFIDKINKRISLDNVNIYLSSESSNIHTILT